MQNRHHTHLTTNVMGISSQLDDRISGGFDEQTVEVLLMQARKCPELMRQRKDHMIIRYADDTLNYSPRYAEQLILAQHYSVMELSIFRI